MAASAGPRPGWSRRAQYGLFFSFLAVIAGLIIGLVMPVGQTNTSWVEVKSPAKVTHELQMGVPTGVDHGFDGTQVGACLILRRLGENDVIERFRRAVITKKSARTF